MPLPLLPLLYAAGAAAVSAAAAGGAYYHSKKKKAKSEKFKNIAILGPRESGKTTLATFLKTGKIKEQTVQNISTKTRKVADNFLSDEDCQFQTFDHAGTKEAYVQWRNSFKDSDWAFYLFDITDIDSNDGRARKRLVDDFYQIGDWIKQSKKKVILIFTHEDKLSEEKFSGENRIAQIKDWLLKTKPIVQAQSYVNPNNFALIIGSLADVERATRLVGDVAKEIDND